MAAGSSRRQAGDGAADAAPSAVAHDRRAAARDAALRLLAVRERSAAELGARLRQKGFDPLLVDEVLRDLARAGLQDDARFSDLFAAEAGRARGLAGRRIQAELRARGIDRELAAAAATVDPDEEEARARDLAKRKARTLGHLPPPVRARRIAGQLARRGYDGETCLRIAREVAGVEDDDGASG